MEEMNENLLERIRALLLEGHAAVSKANHQKLILILGATGCGKSTAVNYLTGCQMREVIDELTGETSIECEDPVAEISSSVFSKTLYPNVVELKVPLEGFDAMLCDTAGFGDNRGVAHDICAAVLLGELFRNSETIKGIIVLIPEEDILENRLTKVLDLFQQLNLCLNKKHFQNSIMFLISKNFQKKTEKQIYYIMKTKYAQFCEGTAEQIQDKKWLFEELLKEEGKNIHLCNPLDVEARDSILKSVMLLEEVREKNTAFEYPISADTKLTVNILVNSMVSAILSDADHYLKEYNKALSHNIQLSNRIEELKMAENLVQSLKVLSEKQGANVDIDELLKITAGSGINSNQSCTELVELISQKLRILESLQGYCEEPMKITVLSTQIEILIQSGTEKIMEKGIQLAVGGLESIMDTLEIQNYIAAKGLKQVYNQLCHSDESQSKEEQLKELSNCLDLQKKEEYESNLSLLFSYGKRGDDMVNSLVDRFLANPFDIQPVVKNNRNIYYIISRTQNLVMSNVVTSLINMKLSDTDTLYFMAKNTIYMDENLGMKIASGKNVVLACRDLWVGSNVKINVSGEDGQKVQGNPYGQNGENGKDAGNIFLFVRGEIMNYSLTLVANGGNGSAGTNGEPGVAGEKGKDGVDASYFEDFTWYDTDKGVIQSGTNGEPGKQGGKGGNAGVGGNGGRRGKIILITDPADDQAELLKKCKITAMDGEKGADGEPGAKGPGGKGGYMGFSTFSYLYSNITKLAGDSGRIYFKGYFSEWHHVKCLGIWVPRPWSSKNEPVDYAYRDGEVKRRYAASGKVGGKGDYNAPNQVTSTAPCSLDEKDIIEEYNVHCGIQKGAM